VEKKRNERKEEEKDREDGSLRSSMASATKPYQVKDTWVSFWQDDEKTDTTTTMGRKESVLGNLSEPRRVGGVLWCAWLE